MGIKLEICCFSELTLHMSPLLIYSYAPDKYARPKNSQKFDLGLKGQGYWPNFGMRQSALS